MISLPYASNNMSKGTKFQDYCTRFSIYFLEFAFGLYLRAFTIPLCFIFSISFLGERSLLAHHGLYFFYFYISLRRGREEPFMNVDAQSFILFLFRVHKHLSSTSCHRLTPRDQWKMMSRVVVTYTF